MARGRPFATSLARDIKGCSLTRLLSVGTQNGTPSGEDDDFAQVPWRRRVLSAHLRDPFAKKLQRWQVDKTDRIFCPVDGKAEIALATKADHESALGAQFVGQLLFLAPRGGVIENRDDGTVVDQTDRSVSVLERMVSLGESASHFLQLETTLCREAVEGAAAEEDEM